MVNIKIRKNKYEIDRYRGFSKEASLLVLKEGKWQIDTAGGESGVLSLRSGR